MANLNEHPASPHPFKLEELLKISRGSKIFTKDGTFIGESQKLHRRLENVDRSLKLYEFYLECSRPEMGNSAFVPTDFIEEINNESDRIDLKVPMKDFLAERWDVSPEFIAFAKGMAYKLEN